MKESYRKDVASHPGSESWARRRKATGQALTGVPAGWVWSCEIKSPGGRRRSLERKATRTEASDASFRSLRLSQRPQTCRETPCARTGRPQVRPTSGNRRGPVGEREER
jgi:hypothetical protein